MNINNLFKIVYCTTIIPNKLTKIEDWISNVLSSLNKKSNKNYLFDKEGNHI